MVTVTVARCVGRGEVLPISFRPLVHTTFEASALLEDALPQFADEEDLESLGWTLEAEPPVVLRLVNAAAPRPEAIAGEVAANLSLEDADATADAMLADHGDDYDPLAETDDVKYLTAQEVA